MDAKLQYLAKEIRVAFFDSDGVLFPNIVLMGALSKPKYRSYYDGQGISLLRAIGIRVVFITNEKNESAAAVRETVEKWNDLPSSKPKKADGWEQAVLYEGRGGPKKLETALEHLEKLKVKEGLDISFDECSYMGDDLIDAQLLKAVRLSAAPAQAEEGYQETLPVHLTAWLVARELSATLPT
jgi:3-deoxy-D-manno-octulosonate 8-phosphate phosphatase KdsC-like HAD superfamily phosphatase